MALVLKNRVKETSNTTGTGSLTLLGASTGYQSFSTAIGNGNTTYYTLYDNVAQVWEVGIGTVSAGTLARTTVLSNSSGTTSPLTLAGNQVAVFCTYPAEKSVNLDASGNVTALGTVASGTWQGTTVGVAYGGTGVTASSGANSVVLRDANQNIVANNLFLGFTSTVSTGGTTTLTVASTNYQRITGTTTQTVKLPDATTLPKGLIYIVDNDSTGNVTVIDNASTTLDTVVGGSIDNWVLLDNSTTAGTWIAYSLLPSTYDFGTSTANFGNATITNAVWNGTTIASGYGGTGLTTFTAANYALYSTSSSALTAGTLPVAAGGTSFASYTTGDLLYASGSTTLSKLGIGTNGYVLTSSGSGPQWTAATSVGVTSISFGSTGLTPATATQGAVTVAGTLGIGYGGTGQTTASAAFNALSPITSTGDLIIGNGTNSATRLAIGANNYVLTSNGTTASWAAASSGVTISDDTSTNATRYPTFTSATSGSVSTENVSSTKLTYNPSTGALTSPEIVASNGLLVHSTTVSTSYSIPSGSNAIAAGPMTVASGASVTIPSGSRWLVL